MALIHMNGRIYDYMLGRFLSVDPIIQNPLSSQGLNPYSYIGNNPLAGKDPTGYEACTGSHIDRNDGSSCADQGVSGGGYNSSPAPATQTRSSGASGQGANSIKTTAVATGDQGNPTKDPSSQVNGNPASPNNNGGSQPPVGTSTLGAQYAGGPSIMDGCPPNCPEPEKGLEPVGIAGFDNIAIDLAGYGRTVQQNGFFSAASAVGVLGLSVDALTVGKGGGAVNELETVVVTAVGDLRSAGLKDAHHVIQDAAVRDLPGYNTRLAPGVQLRGPSTAFGTSHYLATQVQRQAGGGTYAAERRIGYKALRAAGYSEGDARQVMKQVDSYFESIGATPSSVTRVPGNRD